MITSAKAVIVVCLLATLRKNFPLALHEIFSDNGPMNK